MSILSRLLEKAATNYGDDVARAAGNSVAKSAAKTAAKTVANSVDDVARTTTSKAAKTAIKQTAKKAASKAANTVDDVVRAGANQVDDVVRAATNQADDVAKGIAKKSAKKATKSSFVQRNARKNADDYIKGFGNVSSSTRRDLFNDYAGGGKIWERLKNRNIDPANLQDVVENTTKSLGGIQSSLFNYADDAGMRIDLSDLFDNNQLNALTGTQRKRLADIGLDIDSIIGGNKSTVTASKANELYKALRDTGYKMADSADGTQKIWGQNLQKAARAVSDRIDDSLAPISGSFGLKKQTLDALSELGDDPNVIRRLSEIADNDFTASTLRKELQPFMVAQDMVGLKLPAEKTLNIAGIDTGLPNYISKATQTIGDMPLKIAAAAEEHPGAAMAAAAGGAGLLGSLLLGGGGSGNTNVNIGQGLGSSLTSDGTEVGLGTDGLNYGTASLGSAGTGSSRSGTSASVGGTTSQPTINGWTYDDLEQGYMNAMLAGDSSAAAAIQDMIEMLDNKVARQQKSSSSSGNAKAQSGLNILQELYQLYNIAGGGKGVLGGTLTNLLNSATGGSYDQNAAVYNDVMSTSLAPIIKAMGESGALSDSDRKAAEKSMPKITDAPEVAEQKFQALYRILQRSAAGGE